MKNYNPLYFKESLIVLTTFILYSCGTYNTLSVKEVEGVYVQKELKGVELRLNKDSFVFIDTYKQEHLPAYECCDTITYGSWKLDKKLPLIKLSSPEEFSNYSENYDFYYTDVDVTEEIVKDKKLTFIISNPIEEFYKKYGKKYRDIEYKVFISSSSPNFDKAVSSKKYSKDTIVINKKENIKIYEIDIAISINSEISLKNLEVRHLYTLPYKAKNPKSNLFKIDIPELSYGFLSYKRLKDDYVKIINKNKLLWDGKEYIRK